MERHDEIRMEIPAYAAGRLDEPARGRLEAHLRECDSCKEMVTTFQELVRELREEGVTLFEPHPDALVLRSVARGEEPPDAAGIRRHLEACPTCNLEVRAWQGVLAKNAGTPASPPPGSRTVLAASALSAAAGLVLGLGLAVLLRSGSPGSPAPQPPPSPVPALSPPAPWSGSPELIILPRLTRGAERQVSWRVRREEPYLSVAVPVFVPGGTPDSASCRFDLRRAGGESVWTLRMIAGEVRERLSRSEAVNLLLPTAPLLPGSYELRCSLEEASGEQLLYRIQVEITRPE